MTKEPRLRLIEFAATIGRRFNHLHSIVKLPASQKPQRIWLKRQWHEGNSKECVLYTLPTRRHYRSPSGAKILIGTKSVWRNRAEAGETQGKGEIFALHHFGTLGSTHLLFMGEGGLLKRNPISTGSILGKRVREMRTSNKDLKKFVNRLLANRWRAEFGKHLKLRSPDGQLFTCSLSPSCPHAHKNLARDIRKYSNRSQGPKGLPLNGRF